MGSNRDPAFQAVLSLAEATAREYGWRVSSRTRDRVEMRVPGDWSDYDLTLAYQPHLSIIEVRCVFALAPPRERWVEVAKLAERLNRGFYRGTLELRIDEDHGSYSDWVRLQDVHTEAQPLFEVMRSAVGTCDMLLFPAFHCVAWAEVNAETALGRVNFGMVGSPLH